MSRTIALLTLPMLVLSLACGPSLTPEEELELNRSRYVAELSSINLRQIPTEEEVIEVESDEDEEMEVFDGEEEEFVRTDVILDILVSTEHEPTLDGVTLDLTHVDVNRNEKGRRTLYIDTSSLIRGVGAQISHVIEDVDYQEGDGFHVEVRVPIPAGERGEYREYDSL